MRRSLEQYKDGFPTYENEGILAMARNMRNGARRHPHGLEDGPGGPSGIMPISFKDQLDKDLAQANGFASDQLLDNVRDSSCSCLSHCSRRQMCFDQYY